MIELSWIETLREETEVNTKVSPEDFVEFLHELAGARPVVEEPFVQVAENRVVGLDSSEPLFEGTSAA